MTDQPDFLAQFSNALSARAEAAKSAVVAIRLPHGRHITGMLWHSGIVVASEQSLPRKDDFEVVAPDGAVLSAKLAGRDPSTNIAILRPDGPIAARSIRAGEA
ncbi:MAG: serine protease, partial [Bradyrhizobium sp.]